MNDISRGEYIFEDLELLKEFNIIGVYKTDTSRINIKTFDTNYREKRRNDGFYALSNKKEISRHLTKSKFCEIKIKTGSCFRRSCNFAHSMYEISFPECAFKEECKKKNTCVFKHPHETLDEYKNRIYFSVPPNMG
jgi:hypothetical protein